MNRNNILGLVFIGILLSAKILVLPWLDNVSIKKLQIEQLQYTNLKLDNLEERKLEAEKSAQTSEMSTSYVHKKAFIGNNPSLISSRVLTKIKQLAKVSGVTVKNQSLGEFKPGVINILPISTFVEGDLRSVALFITSLESGEKLFMVDQATIAKGRGKKSKQIRVNLQLLAMVIKDE